jgi:Zn-finger nucleic acid-binding protein
MQCPVDGTVLQMMERRGVEIDYCPQCRGVWLDRGELDKIIAESSRHEPSRERQPEQRGYDHGKSRDYYKPKKRESFLERIFDF